MQSKGGMKTEVGEEEKNPRKMTAFFAVMKSIFFLKNETKSLEASSPLFVSHKLSSLLSFMCTIKKRESQSILVFAVDGYYGLYYLLDVVII